ncbi:BTAD domain-containing putative transcriptional regulator [Phytohabitans rumicis]|uniref:SARP family transcriptional regulator n=1 Tax=Phytohabitans rumicis TaxID=1076125 RepID=A0A6V8LJZ7_9ACTN|nr:BTAD domain-containing putative transcriptional regulator [Phytohabitans rumicis]GFJ94397.1 SARP family transcriptional regulator [Phytohabitans rumicis]
MALGGPRVRALLALLALDAGRLVPAERLIDGLYGDHPPAGAANALQSQVSRLRQTLGEYARVEFDPAAGYRLAVERDDVDAHRFARLAGEGRRALQAGDLAGAAAALGEALELWRGPALADAPYATAPAARLEELRLGAVEDKVAAELGLGGHAGLVAELRDLVAAHPLRERLRVHLMGALHGSGRQAEALAAYEEGRRILAEELGVDPSPEMSALHVAILRDEAIRAPRLPGQLTSFVGREEELRRVGKLLGEARLVTLHGPGGAGKTRLAIEAAGRQDGDVCLVELAPVAPGEDVPQAVLAALGLREAGLRGTADRRDATERLVAALADRRLLIVLDNCEHVVADAARLAARLLGACPGLRILATSREPLGLTGEALCPVVGLAVPPPDAVDALVVYPAVRLFADRAADVAPGFAVDDNHDAVLRICRTLDGLPLAIELAAARLRALPVAEVAARLDDRFRLLNRGSRTAEPRHQTLRAVVGWSWDLLDAAEQRLARRLTVFAGGATLAAAEAVCGADVDVLTGLVDKSLVVATGDRYWMLETVRAFCAERLAEAGEIAELRAAHAAYFLDLARTADPHLRRAEQLEWLRRLDADRDNLHAALRRATADDPPAALRLVAALAFYWWLRGLRTESAALATRLLAQVGTEPPPGLAEEYALCALTASLGGAGCPQLPVSVWAAGEVLPKLDRPPAQPFLLYLSALATGPPEGGPMSGNEMLELWGDMLGVDPWILALGSIGVGLTLLYYRRVESAEREIATALAGFRALGERWGMMVALSALAEFADWRGDHAAAAAPMGEALRLAEALDSTVDIADLLRIRADGRVYAGDLDGGRDDYLQAVAHARRSGALELLAAAHLGLGEVARRRGDLAGARTLCETALAECPTGWFSAEATRFAVHVALGRIAEAEGDPAAARAWYRRGLAGTAGTRSMFALTDAVEGLVGLAEGERAALLLGAGAALGAVDADAGRERAGDAAAFARGVAMTREEAIRALSADGA